MEIELWENFGEHLRCVSDLNYFPEDWELPYSSEERFVDFVKLYEKDYKIKEFRNYNPLEVILANQTGFFNLPQGKISLMEDNYYGQFVFLKDGEIRYLQNIEEKEDCVKKEQVFFGKESLLYKLFEDSKENLYWEKNEELGEEYSEVNLGDEFYQNLEESDLSEPSLSEVHREIRFELDKKYVGYIRQMSLGNIRINLNYLETGKPFVHFILNSSVGKEEEDALKTLKRNSLILKDFSKFTAWVGSFAIGTETSKVYWEMVGSLKNSNKNGLLEGVNGF